MRHCLYQVLCYVLSFYAPKRRTKIAEKICGEKPVCLPGDILTAIRKNYGLGSMFLAELLLFGWGIGICLTLDLLFDSSALLWKIPGLLVCIASFSLCEESQLRAFSKVAFIVFSFCCGDLWTLTAVVLIAFEHIAIEKEFGQGGMGI